MCSFNHEISELHITYQKNIRITKFLKTMKTNQISSKDVCQKLSHGILFIRQKLYKCAHIVGNFLYL